MTARYRCPECGRNVGRNGFGLAKHWPGDDPLSWGVRSCDGTGLDVQDGTVEPAPEAPRPAPRVVREPVPPPPAWIPPVQPLDAAPFRRWRALGWTREQIAAVTGPGALW